MQRLFEGVVLGSTLLLLSCTVSPGAESPEAQTSGRGAAGGCAGAVGTETERSEIEGAASSSAANTSVANSSAANTEPRTGVPGEALPSRGALGGVEPHLCQATVAPEFCGDGLCEHPEACDTCSADCGECSRSIELYFTQPHPDAAIARQDSRIGILEATLLGDLLSARRTIDVAIYDLTRPSVVEALREAALRGVDVRVLTECENRSGLGAEAMDALSDGGVQVRDDGSSFGGSVEGCPLSRQGRMHHKFLVIDSRTVWVGSTNLTWTGLGYNDNAILRMTSEPLAQVFLAEHGFLWNGGRARPLHRASPVRLRVGGTTVEVAFSGASSEVLPKGAPSPTRQLVTAAVESAQTQIQFAAFYLTDEDVVRALRERWTSGVDVAGILDASGASSGSSRHGLLCDAGLEVRVENRPGKVHHKLLVVDGHSQQGHLILGSANFTQSGFEHNDEAVVHVVDPTLARQASFEVAELRLAPENQGASCVVRSAETPTDLSPRCEGVPCVCQDGLDNDHDGRSDDEDGDCELAP